MIRSRLRAGDALALGSNGLRSRPTRAVLSALGIAIGIAAMVAVVGISTSGQARLNAEFASLGTNLLTVNPGKDLAGRSTKLPAEAPAAIGRLKGVEAVASVGVLDGVPVYRSAATDPRQTGGLSVAAADEALLDTVGASLAQGNWLTAATGAFPTVVLGATAAERLGVVETGGLVLIGGVHHEVIGILERVQLAPELDSLALMGVRNAAERFGYDSSPTTVYERSADEDVSRLRQLLAPAANPANPAEVEVSRPSDALAAKYATDEAFNGLLLGLGSIALLVGGIGVANTMIISVLERRREIGLRRSLGATRSHVQIQFLTEALLLSLMGGVAGSVLGFGVTAALAILNGWLLAIPPVLFVFAIGSTLAIGAIAGLYPALRAARLPPTAALSAQ